MHLRRNETPLSWAIPRKGTKFLVVPMHNKRKGIPLLVLMRDIMKVAKTKKEAKKIIHEEKVKVNTKVVKDEKYPLLLFDIMEIGGKSYKIILKNRKFSFEETKESEKIAKIIGKRALAGNKMQVNLNDGRNFISKEKVSTGDSIIIDLKTGKPVKILPLKKGERIEVIGGKHLGEHGKIEEIDEKNKEAKVTLKDSQINLKLRDIMAVK